MRQRFCLCLISHTICLEKSVEQNWKIKIHMRDLFFLLADTFLPLARLFSSAQLFSLALILKTATIFIAGSEYIHVWWSRMADLVDNYLEDFKEIKMLLRDLSLTLLASVISLPFWKIFTGCPSNTELNSKLCCLHSSASMDLHHNIWSILLLSLPSQDIILGPGMQLCWHQPKRGAYLRLVTEPFSWLLRNYGTVFQRRSETFRSSHLLNKLLKHTFLR